MASEAEEKIVGKEKKFTVDRNVKKRGENGDKESQRFDPQAFTTQF